VAKDSDVFLNELKNYVNMTNKGKIKGKYSIYEVARFMNWRNKNIHFIEYKTQDTFYPSMNQWIELLNDFESYLVEEKIESFSKRVVNADFLGSMLTEREEMLKAMERAWNKMKKEGGK
jgi:hypothetical protein